jgi:hypothetical protein
MVYNNFSTITFEKIRCILNKQNRKASNFAIHTIVHPQLRREKKTAIYGKKNLKMMRRMILNFEIKLKVSLIPGRAIAQAVSRRLTTAASRVQTRVWSCGIL